MIRRHRVFGIYTDYFGGSVLGKTVYNGFEPFLYAAQLKDSKMKNLILIALIFLIACGSGSEDTLERPSVSPPDETEDDTPPETLEIEINGETTTVGTRNLYDAEEIKVFYTGYVVTDSETSFEDLLIACINRGISNGHISDRVGVLSGFLKDQGYIKDFLLNPDVDRIWTRYPHDTSDQIADIVNISFDNPTSGLVPTCKDSPIKIDKPCMPIMCGTNEGD